MLVIQIVLLLAIGPIDIGQFMKLKNVERTANGNGYPDYFDDARHKRKMLILAQIKLYDYEGTTARYRSKASLKRKC